MKRPPSLAQLNKTVADFNAAHPVGTAVIYTSVLDDPKTAKITKTRTEAWVASGHSAVVMVEGISGWVLCGHVVEAKAIATTSPSTP